MDYPHISLHTSQEELIEHFTLTPDERYLLQHRRKEKNILGFAVLLKTFLYLGFPARRKEDVPVPVISWLSRQLNVGHEE